MIFVFANTVFAGIFCDLCVALDFCFVFADTFRFVFADKIAIVYARIMYPWIPGFIMLSFGILKDEQEF